jgi:hypothetical protein
VFRTGRFKSSTRARPDKVFSFSKFRGLRHRRYPKNLLFSA